MGFLLLLTQNFIHSVVSLSFILIFPLPKLILSTLITWLMYWNSLLLDSHFPLDYYVYLYFFISVLNTLSTLYTFYHPISFRISSAMCLTFTSSRPSFCKTLTNYCRANMITSPITQKLEIEASEHWSSRNNLHHQWLNSCTLTALNQAFPWICLF